MSGLSDLVDLHHLSDAERLALCQELGRLNRMVPLSLAPVADAASPDAEAAGAGESTQQGVPL